jgi:hypothetical protein
MRFAAPSALLYSIRLRTQLLRQQQLLQRPVYLNLFERLVALLIPQPGTICAALVLLVPSNLELRLVLSGDPKPPLPPLNLSTLILSFKASYLHTQSVQMVGLISAAGLIGFLSEPDPELRVFALKQLDSQVDLLWTEIANSISQM